MVEIFDTVLQRVVPLSVSKSHFRKLFNEMLDYEGEYVLPNTKTDYIIGVIRVQKFWSGNAVRFYWDNHSKSFTVESRW